MHLSITYRILQSTYHISFPPIATYQPTCHISFPPITSTYHVSKIGLSRLFDYLTPKADYHARSNIPLERPMITPGRLSDHHNNEFTNLHKIVLPNRQETRVWIWANSKLRIQCWVKLP